MAQAELIRVRATVNLRGLPVGAEANVDPTDKYIAEALAAKTLVPVTEPSAGDDGG